MSDQPAANPLFDIGSIPDLKRIELAHFEPALNQLISDAKSEIEAVLAAADESWESSILPYQESMERLSEAWGVLAHFNAVMNTDELREIYDDLLVKMTAFRTEIAQDERLYQLHQKVRQSGEFETLREDQKAAIEHALLDFKLSGVALEAADKKRFAEMSQRLSSLSNKFSQNVLDATYGWSKHLPSDEDLTGIPEAAKDRFAAAAKAKGYEGGYLLTIDVPSYMPVITYCQNRELRKEVYDAYMCRASDQGPNAGEWDNSEIMREILALRQSQSKLLSYDNYAQYSLASKMASSTDEVEGFLTELVAKSTDTAKLELEELTEFARQKEGVDQLEMWDLPYYSEQLKQQRFGFSKEALRAYFPVDKVLSGLFSVAGQLFGIEVRQAESFGVYHPDARYFEIVSEGEVVAGVVMDLFAREGKRGGAWLGSCKSRYVKQDGSLCLPIAFLVCNFTPPSEDLPSLLTPEEVTTLFHEFGHCLHYTLTEIDTASVAGIRNVPWDAVELPSQMLENWCFQESVLPMISGHYETGEPVPAEFVLKLKEAEQFQGGMMMLRQIEFALFDMVLHRTFVEGETDPLDVLNEIRAQVAVKQPPEYTRFAHGFGHIFAGGYAAGYYSYKWAEVLAADAFSRFDEEGLLEQRIGEEFKREFLSKGGSRDVMDMFVAFRGRRPDVNALLKQSGIGAA